MPLPKYRNTQLEWEARNPTYRLDYYNSHKERAIANVYRYRRVNAELKRFRMILFDLNDYETNNL